MQRTDTFEKTLMLGKIEGRRNRGTRTLPEFITEFGKSARYKMNTPKFLAFLYTNDE